MAQNGIMGQGVLSEEHYQQLRLGLDQAQEAKRQIVLARQAGINVDAQADQVDAAELQIRRLLQTYFPGR